MNMEKDTTGLYLSGHPMEDYRPWPSGPGRTHPRHHVRFRGPRAVPKRLPTGENVTVAGVITASRTRTTKTTPSWPM